MSYRDLEDKLVEETRRVVEIAIANGADNAVAAMTQKSEFQVEVRNNEIENLSEADFHSVSLTVSKDGRRATVSSCDLSPESIAAQVDQALAMCKYTDQDPFYHLPDPASLATAEDNLDLYDEQVEAIDVNEKIQRVLALEKAMLGQDSRLLSDGCSLSTIAGTSVLANSLGFSRPKKSSLIYLGASAFASDQVSEGDLNTGRKQTASWATRARFVEDLESPEEVAKVVASRVLRKLGARKPPSGKYPVYFDPSLAKSLWGNLIAAISGTQIYRHESYLEGKLGQAVASPLVTIYDDPTIKRGLASRVFDSEGLACKAGHLVEEGILSTYLLGCYSARKLGMQPTGHGGGPGNLIIKPGTLSEEDMLQQMGTGIWLTSLLGQGVNISTGDYSRGAFGLWVENGKVQYPVMEFTINSNLAEMFAGIVMVGNNVATHTSVMTPGLVIQEMSISGA